MLDYFEQLLIGRPSISSAVDPIARRDQVHGSGTPRNSTNLTSNGLDFDSVTFTGVPPESVIVNDRLVPVPPAVLDSTRIFAPLVWKPARKASSVGAF